MKIRIIKESLDDRVHGGPEGGDPDWQRVSNVELTSREVEYLQKLLEEKNKNLEGRPWPKPDGDIMSKLSATKNVELSSKRGEHADYADEYDGDYMMDLQKSWEDEG
jgi:hypothetical protein